LRLGLILVVPTPPRCQAWSKCVLRPTDNRARLLARGPAQSANGQYIRFTHI
jgi:hypothetical protein